MGSLASIYLSHLSALSSGIEYSQNHWCPTALNLILGLFTSSPEYRTTNLGTTRKTNVTPGNRVHTVSTISLSSSIALK